MLYKKGHVCNSGFIELPVDITDALKAVFLKAATRIYRNNSNDIDPELQLEIAKIYEDALDDAFGFDYSSVEYDSLDLDTVNHIRHNLFAFSAAKSFQQMLDIRDMILDGDEVKPFSKFKKDVMKIHESYNVNYLRTEYNHTIAASQNARDWIQYQNDKDIYSALEYRTAGDSRVRDGHRALNGIVKDKDDVFWNTYYPPNGWGCRCRVEQTNSKTTDTGTTRESVRTLKKEAPMAKMFQNNPGKQKIVYSQDHPYEYGFPYATLKASSYNMKDPNLLSDKSKYVSKPVKTKEEFKEKWEKLKNNDNGIVLNDKNLKRKVFISDQVRDKYLDDNRSTNYPNRWKYFNDSLNAIKTPDEIWWTDKKSKSYKTKLATAYIKYDDKGASVVMTENKKGVMNVVSWQRYDGNNLKNVNSWRMGILMKRK